MGSSVHPWKIKGWNLKITCLKKGTSSSIHLHDFGFQMLIFQGVLGVDGVDAFLNTLNSKLGISILRFQLFIFADVYTHTVDGRNSAPVDMVDIPLFTWFYTSQVVQDFFHQQYVSKF